MIPRTTTSAPREGRATLLPMKARADHLSRSRSNAAIVSGETSPAHHERESAAEHEALVHAILADRVHADETIEEMLDAIRARR